MSDEDAIVYETIDAAAVERTRKQAAHLLTLAQKMDDGELLDLGITKAEVSEIRHSSLRHKIPRAQDMMFAAMAQGVGRDLALVLHHRATVAIHAMAPIVAFRLAGKVDDAKAPGSTRVLLEIAKGIGLLQPAEPVSQGARMAQLDLAELRKLSAEDLKNELLRSANL